MNFPLDGKQESSFREPRNRPAADIIGTRNLARRLLTGITALDRFLLLMMLGEHRHSTKPYAARHLARAANLLRSLFKFYPRA